MNKGRIVLYSLGLIIYLSIFTQAKSQNKLDLSDVVNHDDDLGLVNSPVSGLVDSDIYKDFGLELEENNADYFSFNKNKNLKSVTVDNASKANLNNTNITKPKINDASSFSNNINKSLIYTTNSTKLVPSVKQNFNSSNELRITNDKQKIKEKVFIKDELNKNKIDKKRNKAKSSDDKKETSNNSTTIIMVDGNQAALKMHQLEHNQGKLLFQEEKVCANSTKEGETISLDIELKEHITAIKHKNLGEKVDRKKWLKRKIHRKIYHEKDGKKSSATFGKGKDKNKEKVHIHHHEVSANRIRGAQTKDRKTDIEKITKAHADSYNKDHMDMMHAARRNFNTEKEHNELFKKAEFEKEKLDSKLINDEIQREGNLEDDHEHVKQVNDLIN